LFVASAVPFTPEQVNLLTIDLCCRLVVPDYCRQVLLNSGVEDWKKRFPPTVKLSKEEVGIQWEERVWVGQQLIRV